MLVLSRKKGESIIITDQVEVTILSVEGDTVKVGIKAPSDIDIFRKEIYLSIKESNQESAAPAPSEIHTLIDRIREAKN
ncbi:carbon storage regulator CsrA [Paenibacillus sp. FSL P2-0136]|uniref:carbon storage regulator CsrA n=1 Tax=unclassified Paenibacillus TaxID=185978 RepID=UPI0030DB6D10